jgi:hypothetical protein
MNTPPCPRLVLQVGLVRSTRFHLRPHTRAELTFWLLRLVLVNGQPFQRKLLHHTLHIALVLWILMPASLAGVQSFNCLNLTAPQM